MRQTITTVDATFPIDIYDGNELAEHCRDIEPQPAGIYGISSRDWAGKGYAIVGTPGELFEWLSRADNELTRKIHGDNPTGAGLADACELLRRVGTEHHQQDCRFASDAELWSIARAAVPDGLPDDNDPLLLPDLRDAYNEGRNPGRYNLFRLGTMIRTRGVPAYVAHTGGNTATLYAGQPLDGRTDDGQPVYPVQAGPGTFDPTHSSAVSDVDDFGYGPHRNPDEGIVLDEAEPPTYAELADAIALMARNEQARAATLGHKEADTSDGGTS